MWDQMATPPKAPAQFVVELVAVEDVAGAVETEKKPQTISVARVRSAPPPSPPEPQKQPQRRAIHDPVAAESAPHNFEEPEKWEASETPTHPEIEPGNDTITAADLTEPAAEKIPVPPKPVITPTLVTNSKSAVEPVAVRLAGFAPPPKRKPYRVTQPKNKTAEEPSRARTVKKDIADKSGDGAALRVQPDAPPQMAKLTERHSPVAPSTASAGEATAKLIPPRYAAPGRGNPLPVYPRTARRRSLEGRLILRVAIDHNGRVDAVEVAWSSGHVILDRAAERAVRRWKFEPGRRAGIPVRTAIDIPVVFRLKH
jgi:protein TonB